MSKAGPAWRAARAGARAQGPDHPRGAPGGPAGPDRRLAGLDRPRRTPGVPGRGSRPALGAPGRGGRAAWAGRHVVVSRPGTASGKSLAYLGARAVADRGRTGGVRARGDGALPVPDQGAGRRPAGLARGALRRRRCPGCGPRRTTGTPRTEERRWVRDHASYVLTNPDLLHHSLLPGHARWAPFLRGAAVRGGRRVPRLPRGLRVARGDGAAAAAAGGGAVRRRADVRARLGDGGRAGRARPAADRADGRGRSPTTRRRAGALGVALWEPPLLPGLGEHGAPVRRSASTEAGELLADLVAERRADVGVRAVPARGRGDGGRRPARAGRGRPGPGPAGGGLPRRLPARGPARAGAGAALGRAARPGHDQRPRARASTSSGLDAVLLAGWPGTPGLAVAAGRAGRAGRAGVARPCWSAADDPLDTYLMHHPEALFGRPVEASVLDPDNPYVLAPHLAAAAAELPMPGRRAGAVRADDGRRLLDVLVDAGRAAAPADGVVLDPGGAGQRPGRPARDRRCGVPRGRGGDRAGDRHRGPRRGAPDGAPGRGLRAPGADATWSASSTSRSALALVERADAGVVDLRARAVDGRPGRDGPVAAPGARSVRRSGRSTSRRRWSGFLRRLPSGEVLGEEPLDLPPRTLRTRAVWWTMPPALLAAAGIARGRRARGRRTPPSTRRSG